MDKSMSFIVYLNWQTPSITTSNIGYLPDIRIFLVRGHGTCIVEKAQNFIVRIMNCTQRSMDLSLSFDNGFSKREQFIWIGITNRHLGKLDAHQTLDISLQLVPITCGLKVKSRKRNLDKILLFVCFDL